MLNRNCENSISENSIIGIGKLLRPSDFNVRVSINKKHTSRYLTKSFVEGQWRETIRDALGGGLLRDVGNNYLVELYCEERYLSFNAYGEGIMREIWNIVKDSDAFRIDITKVPVFENSVRSWIIARV